MVIRSIHYHVHENEPELVDEYIEYAISLLQECRKLMAENELIEVLGDNLHLVCSYGLGYDPTVLDRIGTTKQEVEEIFHYLNMTQARHWLSILRNGESNATILFHAGWELALLITRRGIKPEELGTSMEEVKSYAGFQSFMRPRYFK